MRELWQFVALDNFKASIATQDHVQSVFDALLREAVLTLEVSLLLAGVENHKAWHLALLEVEHRSEFRLG